MLRLVTSWQCLPHCSVMQPTADFRHRNRMEYLALTAAWPGRRPAPARPPSVTLSPRTTFRIALRRRTLTTRRTMQRSAPHASVHVSGPRVNAQDRLWTFSTSCVRGYVDIDKLRSAHHSDSSTLYFRATANGRGVGVTDTSPPRHRARGSVDYDNVA